VTGNPRPALLFVAPEAFDQAPVNLGAAAKIASLVRILDRLGHEVHYVDSSHWRARWAAPLHAEPALLDGTPVRMWRPAMVPHRKVGKVLNALGAARFASRLARVRPALTWIYNAYAFEGAVADALHRRGVPFVLEIEDLPHARPRGWNPKPHWDQRWFERVLPRAGLVTYVNQRLLERHASRHRSALLLPSVLRRGFEGRAGRPRFAAGEVHRIGYFGGLSAEKGAGVLLEALRHWPDGHRLVVTGQGELGPAFAAAAAEHPQRLEFHGAVEARRLPELMVGCDAVVNPHSAIATMDDGVFPFKVCEALAAGALLISTDLPAIDAPLAGAVSFFDGSAAGLCAAVAGAAAFDATHRDAIDALGRHVAQEYGEGAIAARLAPLLAPLVAAGQRAWGAPAPAQAQAAGAGT
jgi:glycosyltransferase involved in cell wall biosynthesis